MKTCTTCKKDYPATAEYFHRAKQNKDGLHKQCKLCRNKQASEYQKKRWKENKEDIKANTKRYYEQNKDKIMAQQKEYIAKNPRYREYQKQYRIEWGKENKERLNEYQKQYVKSYVKTDRGRMIKNISHYKAKAKFYYGALKDDFSIDDWYEVKEYFNNCCAYCGEKETEDDLLMMEHVNPLSKSQDFTKKNIVPTCRSCNSKKSNCDLDSFYDSWRKPDKFTLERYQKIKNFLDE